MWEKIKRILHKQGGKCIIIENNQPTYLVMKLEDDEEVEKVNQDISQWEAGEKDSDQLIESDNQEIKIEDLPF